MPITVCQPNIAVATAALITVAIAAFQPKFDSMKAESQLHLADTINTGGEKVHPEEVENVLRAFPGVDDCLVIGTPEACIRQVKRVQDQEQQDHDQHAGSEPFVRARAGADAGSS